MKLRDHIAPLVCLVIGLAALAPGDKAWAQMSMQPPFMAPIAQGVNLGVFYVTGGVKYRDFQTLRMNVKYHQIQATTALGSPAFGPNTNGTITYPAAPTGVFAADPNISGIWLYDDGYILPFTLAAGPPPVYPCTYGGITDLGLGHRGDQGALVNCGEFQVVNLTSQPDNSGGLYSTTNTVTMSRVLTGTIPFEVGSQLFGITSDPGTVIQFNEKVFAPYIEVGYQQASFFDIFWGFSWFTLNKRFQNSYPVSATVSRRSYIDTYQFFSDDAANSWTGAPSPWLSSGNATGWTATNRYEIFPQGRLNGTGVPTRVFTTQPAVGLPPIPATETLSNQLDLTVYEFKMGGRSWYPLYGMGRIGSSAGLLITPMPFTAITRSLVTATAAVPAAGVAAGNILIDQITKRDGTWILRNIGLFIGADLEVTLGSLFGRFTAEYDCYFTPNRTDDDTNPDIVESMVLLDQASIQGSASLGVRF